MARFKLTPKHMLSFIWLPTQNYAYPQLTFFGFYYPPGSSWFCCG